MKIGYLLPLPPIAAAEVDAHGGAKPAPSTIRVPPSLPVDARLGFVSVAATPCRGSLQSPRLGFGLLENGEREEEREGR